MIEVYVKLTGEKSCWLNMMLVLLRSEKYICWSTIVSKGKVGNMQCGEIEEKEKGDVTYTFPSVVMHYCVCVN